jgi:ribulose-bisphosphate carboxylase large chain
MLYDTFLYRIENHMSVNYFKGSMKKEKNNLSKSNLRFSVLYRITVSDGRTIEEHARDLTLEQTVEVPPDCVPGKIIRGGIPGRVENIITVAQKVFDVSISFRCDITDYTVPQFLNTVFGNISLKNNIKIIGFDFPEAFLACFPGPSHGVDGIRKLLGVYDRPLACTALKPMGLSVRELASMAKAMARGGADLIKDDHGISNQPFHPFSERVPRCAEAIATANARTGRKTIYCPTVSGRFDEIERQVRCAVGEGVSGILIAPMLVGFDTVRYLSETYKLVTIGHPSLTGTNFHSTKHGMTPAALLGTIFRLIGTDISVFPNAGGRFFFTQKECTDLAAALKKPLGPLKTAFPCPAGGMSLEKISDLSREYGKDTVLLIGGALIRHSPDRAQGITAFMERIRSLYMERLENPADEFASSCEWKAPSPHSAALTDLLTCNKYRWTEGARRVEPYKTGPGFDFKGIIRQELIGKSGEKTSFDLRYFEIEPGGYSSFEKHVHEHVIIGVRGLGICIKKRKKIHVRPNDIAYVGPMEEHRMRNAGREPFGFFCIVDHKRDKPIAASSSL